MTIISREEVPDHWDWKKLGEIGEIYSGGTPRRDNAEYFGEGIPWLRLKDVKSFYVDDAEEYITEKGLKNSSAQRMPKGTVIVSTRATIGEVAIARREVATNQGFKSVKPYECISEFIAYYLKLTRKDLEQMGRTTTYPEVNKTQFSNIEIPVPPLSEQKKIVEKLDKIFKNINKAKKSQKEAEKIEKLIIKSTTSKLIPTEDVPEHWNVKKIEDVCEITYGDGLPKRKLSGGDIPVYGSGGVSGYHNESLYDKPSVILGRKGSIDKVWFVEDPFWAIDTTFYTQVVEDVIMPKYLYYFFLSLDLEKYDSSSAIPSLRKTDLNKIEIPVPPLEKQKEIVERLDSIREKVEATREDHRRIDELLETLPKAVLDKAFTGELVEA